MKGEIMEQGYEDFYKDFSEQSQSSYCFRSINAISFVDNNLSQEDRKKYLAHIEQCSICAKYVNSLRKDFSHIEYLVAKAFRHDFLGESDYKQKVTLLTDQLASKQQTGFPQKYLKRFYRFLITKLK